MKLKHAENPRETESAADLDDINFEFLDGDKDKDKKEKEDSKATAKPEQAVNFESN